VKTITALAVAFLLSLGPAWAGPFSDFENQLREAYGSYRIALFQTNSGKQEESSGALKAFLAKWSALQEKWGKAPPPQYADDEAWADFLESVTKLAVKASEQVHDGKMPEAHETLEGVREEVGSLHIRNGIMHFSDRMNTYHTAMEKILTNQSDPGKVREDAAVLAYLVAQALAHPPAEAADSKEYEQLANAFRKAANDFLMAARSGDMETIKASKATLKPSYAKFFLKFG
jgi:hypothetical protein